MGGGDRSLQPNDHLGYPRGIWRVAGRAEVLVDGDVRRGADVLEAEALGPRAPLVGRPILWGLAGDGRAGVERVSRCGATSSTKPSPSPAVHASSASGPT